MQSTSQASTNVPRGGNPAKGASAGTPVRNTKYVTAQTDRCRRWCCCYCHVDVVDVVLACDASLARTIRSMRVIQAQGWHGRCSKWFGWWLDCRRHQVRLQGGLAWLASVRARLLACFVLARCAALTRAINRHHQHGVRYDVLVTIGDLQYVDRTHHLAA